MADRSAVAMCGLLVPPPATPHNARVLIELKDVEGRPRLTLHIDPAKPTTVVQADDGRGPTVTLDWDRAFDDEGHLRHCPVCGCRDFYVRKRVPQLTVFSLIIVAAVIAMIFFGSGLYRPALIVLGVVLVSDLAIFFFAPRMLVCYRCRSEYHDLPIGRGRRRWDPTLAERYAAPSIPPPVTEETTEASRSGGGPA